MLDLIEVVSWDALCDSEEGLEVRGFGALIWFFRCTEEEIRGYVGTGESCGNTALSVTLFTDSVP